MTPPPMLPKSTNIEAMTRASFFLEGFLGCSAWGTTEITGGSGCMKAGGGGGGVDNEESMAGSILLVWTTLM